MTEECKSKRNMKRALSAVGLLFSTLPVGVNAQGVAASSTAPTNSTEVETIIVTASKRSESVQNAVGAITAFTEATLRTRGIQTLDDVTQQTPAMTFYTMSGTQFITLRGVGVPVDTGASDPNTAINVDGVNLPRADEATGSPYDLDRVEVASGPQGTLYGRNATGGAVNFILKKPTDHFTGEAGVGGGNYASWDAHVMVSGPITDGIRVLLSAYGSGREQGFVKNLYNDTTFDRDRQWGARGAVSVDLAPHVQMDLSVGTQYERYDQFQQLMGGTITVPGGAGVGISAVPGLMYSLAPWTIYSTYAEPSSKQTTLGNLTLNWDISPVLHLKSITGATIFSVHGSLDGVDVVPTSQVLPGRQDGAPWSRSQPSNYYSQEFDLSGEFGHGGTWIAGAFFSDERYEVDIPVFLPFGGANYTVGNPNPADPLLGTDIGINFDAHYHEATQAVFADLTLPITNRMRVFGGLRYSHELNDTFYTTEVASYYPNLYSSSLSNATVFTDGCAALGDGSNKTQYDFSWRPVTARGGIQYDFSDHINGYFKYSNGFKDGGSGATLCGNTYQPEHLTAYEVGLKSRLFGGRIVLDLAGYRYDYQDMQIYQDIGSATTQVVNADARIYGFDASLSTRITHGLSLDVVANYLDDYFTKFASVDPSDPDNIVQLPTIIINGRAVPNLQGLSLPGVPDYNVTAGIQDVIPVNWEKFDNILLRVEGNFVGRLDIQEWNRPQTIQHPFAKLNAVVQLSGSYGWTARLFARNLTDIATTYHFLWNGGPNTFNGQYSPPRTFGIEITKRFGG